MLAILLGASRAEAQAPGAAPPAPPGAAPAAGPAAPPGGGLLGAGQPQLVMPPPAPMTPEQLRTVQLLDAAKREDSGRRLEWLWFDVDGGFEQLGLQALNGGDQGFVAGFVKTSSSGGAVSAGVGARFLFLTLLLRARVGVFDSGQLYRVGPEAGFHVPLGRLEPHVALGLGYAAMGNLHDTQNGAASAIALRGFYSRVSGGVDYFLTPAFSIGAAASADLLVLVRPALTSAQVQVLQANGNVDTAHKSSAALLTSTGTGVGGTIAVTGVAGLHF
jgi:hypothetical protein